MGNGALRHMEELLRPVMTTISTTGHTEPFADQEHGTQEAWIPSGSVAGSPAQVEVSGRSQNSALDDQHHRPASEDKPLPE